eukprot:1157566-Pelagomonas_calceolata.AAC.6
MWHVHRGNHPAGPLEHARRERGVSGPHDRGLPVEHVVAVAWAGGAVGRGVPLRGRTQDRKISEHWGSLPAAPRYLDRGAHLGMQAQVCKLLHDAFGGHLVHKDSNYLLCSGYPHTTSVLYLLSSLIRMRGSCVQQNYFFITDIPNLE